MLAFGRAPVSSGILSSRDGLDARVEAVGQRDRRDQLGFMALNWARLKGPILKPGVSALTA